MNTIETIALKKAVADRDWKEAKSGLAAGEYEVSFAARIIGTISKFADEEYVPTTHIPLKAVIALAIRKSGVLREHFIRCLFDAMREALEAGLQGDDKVAAIMETVDGETVADMMDRVQAECRRLPMETRDGKIKARLEIVEIRPN